LRSWPQIKGNFSDINNLDELDNKFYCRLFKNIERQHMYSSIEDSEFIHLFDRNNAGLKKMSNPI
jgi:hypothetical protein